MHGDTAAHPNGVVNGLLNATHATDGGLGEEDIVEILNTPELGVSVKVTRERLKTTATDGRD